MELIGKDGKPVQVDDADATKAFATGQYGVRGATVDVRNKDGTLGTIPADQLHAAIGQGYELVSPEEAQKELLERQYGGLAGGAIETGEGLARGASGSLSDPLAVGVGQAIGGKEGGEAVRKHLANYKAANPTAAMGGEIVGTIAPILLSGGAAAPEMAAIEAGELGAEGFTAGKALAGGARALSTPMRALDAAGNVAERIAAAAVGEGSENLAARLAQKALTTGARGAVEGALYGVGSQISEDVLGDHDLTAEKLLAAAGHGALFGGLTGGALGAGGEAVSSAGGALARKLSPYARSLGETQAWKSLIPAGAMKVLTRKAERVSGGARGIGRFLLDEGLVKTGDDITAIAPRIEEALGVREAKLGELLDEATMAGARVDGARIAARVEKETIGELAKSPNLNSGAIGKMEGLVKDLKLVAESGDIRELRNWRAKLDDQIDWSATAHKPTNDALKKARSIIEDELTDFGDAATKKMGGDWAARYKGAKLEYQRLNVANEAAQQSVQANDLTNNFFSLRDVVSGAAGVVSGGPLGLAATLGSKIARERGSATVATIMDRLADLGAVRKVADRVDRDVARAAAGLVSGERKALTAPERLPISSYETEVEKARAAAASPEAQQSAVQRHLQSVTNNAPKVAAAFAVAASRAATFLASRVPKTDNGRPQMLQSNLHPSNVSDADKASFLRSVKAVNDPRSVMRDMEHGRVSKEGVDALREVYPRLYDDLQKKLLNQVASAKKPMTFQQRQQIALLTGIPTDPNLKPATIRMFQSSFGGQKQTQGMSGPPRTQLRSFGGSDVKLKGQ